MEQAKKNKKTKTTNRKQTIYKTNLLKQKYEKSKQNKRILNKSVDESQRGLLCAMHFPFSLRGTAQFKNRKCI